MQLLLYNRPLKVLDFYRCTFNWFTADECPNKSRYINRFEVLIFGTKLNSCHVNTHAVPRDFVKLKTYIYHSLGKVSTVRWLINNRRTFSGVLVNIVTYLSNHFRDGRHRRGTCNRYLHFSFCFKKKCLKFLFRQILVAPRVECREFFLIPWLHPF